MKEYVAGFLFSPDRHSVLLVLKNRPAYQRGRWNAIGGLVRPGETTQVAMHRKMNHEAGLDLVGWQPFVELRGQDRAGEEWSVTFFRKFSTQIFDAQTKTDERIAWHPTHRLPLNGMNNLPWLCEMALSMDGEACSFFTVQEHQVGRRS